MSLKMHYLNFPLEEGMCHTGKYQVLVRWQEQLQGEHWGHSLYLGFPWQRQDGA